MMEDASQVIPQRCHCGPLPTVAGPDRQHTCGCGHRLEAREWGDRLAWFPALSDRHQQVWIAIPYDVTGWDHAVFTDEESAKRAVEASWQLAWVSGPHRVRGAG